MLGTNTSKEGKWWTYDVPSAPSGSRWPALTRKQKYSMKVQAGSGKPSGKVEALKGLSKVPEDSREAVVVRAQLSCVAEGEDFSTRVVGLGRGTWLQATHCCESRGVRGLGGNPGYKYPDLSPSTLHSPLLASHWPDPTETRGQKTFESCVGHELVLYFIALPPTLLHTQNLWFPNHALVNK